MTIEGHRKFVQWVKDNGVKMFLVNWDMWPEGHEEHVGVDAEGNCYRIEQYYPDKYLVFQITPEEAQLAFVWAIKDVREEFLALVRGCVR